MKIELVALEAHVYEGRRLIAAWYCCPNCGKVFPRKIDRDLCCEKLMKGACYMDTATYETKCVTEALMGEGLASCDRCGAVTEKQLITVYMGPRGEKVDLCPRCWRRAK